ncbi:MAG TPA: glycerophosphoryl diester phosphodiesterase membrane domain-containing protein [Propionibacteriaceae bacterium]|nr:glycerophosphoryl diester phosphodiesterase membrane domain-containing protein [Propionibacteriaceae bacterium]
MPTPLAQHPYGVGDVASNTFAILKRQWRLFAGLTLLPIAFLLGVLVVGIAGFVTLGGAGVLAAVFSGSSRAVDRALAGMGAAMAVAVIAYVVALVGYMLLSLVAQGRMSVATVEAVEGRTSSMASTKQATPGLLGRSAGLVGIGIAIYVAAVLVFGLVVGLFAVVGAALAQRANGAEAIIGLIVMVLYLAFIVGLLFIGVKLLYTIPIMGVEGKSPIDAMKESWSITRGAFWRTLGYYLLAFAILYVIQLVVMFISYFVMFVFGGIGALASSGGSSSSQAVPMLVALIPGVIVVTLLMVAVSLFTIPFLAIWITLMYRDQQVRNANPNLTKAAAGFQFQQAPQYGQPPAQPYGQGTGYPQSYSQSGSGQAYGQSGYGQSSSSPYGQSSPTSQYGQASGYGQTGQASGYGQTGQPGQPGSYGSPSGYQSGWSQNPDSGQGYRSGDGYGGQNNQR